MKYDDVGSLPLPENVNRSEFESAFVQFEDWALEVFQEMMELKIDSGVQVPCYPQLRDINDQFLTILNNSDLIEEPYLVYEDKAFLPEFKALEKLEIDLPEIKICVTGPLELSISEFKGRVYDDIMFNMARSLNRFVKNANSMEKLDIGVLSIDEPSLGTNPELNFDMSSLIRAWNIVAETDMEVQMHLHSPNFYESVCEAEEVDIIDIGMAATPEYFETVDPEILKSFEKKLRVGVSRSDILSLSSEFNEEHDVNIWTDQKAWNDFIERIEPPSKIAERIEKINKKFRDLIEYVGPDCGLGGAKKVEIAEKILKNTAKGINLFLERG